MIIFKTLTVKNFLSIGAITQTIDFRAADLTLILGENLDLGGSGARNGVGKSAALQALCYALFGESMNGIRKDNLINRTNAKNMMVTLDFSVDSIDYRIERGRKPNVLRLFVNNSETGAIEDDAQGENRETQKYIEQILKMSLDMFKIIVCLNTYSEPFLSMKAADQRSIIEQLLGITLLSEKAEKLREEIKLSKDSFAAEEFKIKTLEDSNSRISSQINSLKIREKEWSVKWESDCESLQASITELQKLDITHELAQHVALKAWQAQKSLYDLKEKTKKLSDEWHKNRQDDLDLLRNALVDLNKVDIISELQAHKNLRVYETALTQQAEWNKSIASLIRERDREGKIWNQLDIEVRSLQDHKCYACGTQLHDDAHLEQLKSKQQQLQASQTTLDELYSQLGKLQAAPVFVPSKPTTIYNSETEALQHNIDIKNIAAKITELETAVDPYKTQMDELGEIHLPAKPVTHYSVEADAVAHQQRVLNLTRQLADRKGERNPYSEQIVDMETNTLVKISYDSLNEIKLLWDHQKFLLDLLTNKDSFIRKRIIDQSLLFLNNRLSHYLEKLGLPHTVIFKNDLSVEITEWGRELDFGNLSRGESNRLILGLSFAFRDVWQNLYHDINCLFIDEILDSGMDSLGFESGISLLKEMSRRMNRHVFLVSHREELIGRMPNILKVYKNNGFTEYVCETSK